MKEQTPGYFDKKYIWIVVLIFIGLGGILYANTLAVPFYFDDIANVRENIHIRTGEISLSSLWQAGTDSLIRTRPLANISFALNFALHRYHVAGYHLVNIFIHILTGIFLSLLFQTILQSPALADRYKSHARVVALAAAAYWFANPVHTQTVTYIVQRMNGMATLFYACSLWLFLRGRMATDGRPAWPWLTGAALTGLLALASKEIAVTLPFMMFLAEWYFIHDLDRGWLKRRIPHILALLAFVILITLLLLGGNPLQGLLSGYAQRDFTLTERLLTELRVVVYYLGLLLYPAPSRLNLDYDFPLSHSLLSPPTTIASGAVLLLLLITAVLLAKRARLYSFAVLWFLGNLFIESSVVPLEIIFEHRTYLPSMFVALLVITTGYRFIRQPRLAVGVLVATLCLFSFWTVSRNTLWRDPVLLWTDCATKSPNKSRPHNNLSVALREKGLWEQAFAESQTALRLNPQSLRGQVNLGNLYSDKKMWQQAEAAYRQVLLQKPDYAEVYVSLGNIYAAQKKLAQAAGFFQKALALDPDSVRARTNLASILAYQGRTQEAIVEFEKARALSPGNNDILFNLGLAYERQGRYAEAVRAFAEAVYANPTDKQAAAKLDATKRKLETGR
ncbi:MAG: tetratricopeptide repeat protein [Desulfobulbaceae bacterium]|nr:tetratricopeptide repeat protein [Desulfobulbaceae bacterium]